MREIGQSTTMKLKIATALWPHRAASLIPLLGAGARRLGIILPTCHPA
jgi:hypothetical protein